MAKKLWGGRFSKEIDKDFFKFQKSIHYDYKLAEYDIVHSFVHVRALLKAGILSNKEASRLLEALKKVDKKISIEIKQGKFNPNDSEDIHTEIQNRVEKQLGKKLSSLALKLHSLRSRNDQIVFDERFYCRKKALDLKKTLINLGISLLSLAKNNIIKEFLGYTHTQRAQAIYFSDYLLAYNNMFQRDSQRIERFYDNLNVFIGAGALTGSSLTKKNYDEAIKEYLKESLLEINGKIKPVDNPIDNVSDRDFILEFLSVLSIMQMHLSRLSEDLILYSTKEFNLIDLPEEFCTGSSLMPHKKNPDFLELVRGNTGKIYGNLLSVLTTMKGLPLSYNRDMQLDKEPLFSSVEVIEEELKIMSRLVKKIELKEDKIRQILEQDITLYATEIAEKLVKDGNEPFKKAHDIVGKFVKLLEKNEGDIRRISDTELTKLHPMLTKALIKELMKPGKAISLKRTFSRSILKKKGIKDSELL